MKNSSESLKMSELTDKNWKCWSAQLEPLLDLQSLGNVVNDKSSVEAESTLTCTLLYIYLYFWPEEKKSKSIKFDLNVCQASWSTLYNVSVWLIFHNCIICNAYADYILSTVLQLF